MLVWLGRLDTALVNLDRIFVWLIDSFVVYWSGCWPRVLVCGVLGLSFSLYQPADAHEARGTFCLFDAVPALGACWNLQGTRSMAPTAKQRKRRIKCGLHEQRYTAVRLGTTRKTFAARSFEAAMDFARPNRGAQVEVYAVCARDSATAKRKVAREQSQLLRKFTYKGKK